MTYRQLIERLSNLSEEQKDCDVTVWLAHRDEFFPLDDVLDRDHPFLLIRG